jgi:signal peptidase I
MPCQDQTPFELHSILSESDSPTIPSKTNTSTNLRQFLREIVSTTVLVLGLYTLLNLAIPRFVVEGQSMEPNIHTSEYVMVSRIHYVVHDPQRGDVIVFHLDENNDLIKRVIGLPGEHIKMEDGHIWVDDEAIEEPYIKDFCYSVNCDNREWVLGPDEYFVLGDNRNNSNDSLNFGPIQRHQIVGKVLASYWPPEYWRIFSNE